MRKKIKFAIIGCGIFGEKSLLPAFQITKYAEFKVITKRDATHAQKLATKWNIPKGMSSEDLTPILTDPEIDAVYIASPNALHYSQSIQALKAGKHVLVEKPMAMNPTECQEMITTARESNRQIMVAQCLRYNSTIIAIKNLITSGEIGKVITCNADFYSNGFASKRQWKFDFAMAGGGAAFDLGVHMLDTLRFLIDQPIAQIYCMHHPTSVTPNNMDLVTTYLMQFDSGIIGKATGTYLGLRTTHIEVHGEKGYIRASNWNDIGTRGKLQIKYEKSAKDIMVINENHYMNMIDSFADAILNNQPNPIPGEEGLINQKYLEMIFKKKE